MFGMRRSKGGSHFKVCWAGKLVIGDHVTGFLISGRRGLRLDPDTIGEAKPTAVRSAADLSAPKRGTRRRPAIRCKPFVMERSESNFLFRAYVFTNASAESKAIIGRRLGKLAMGSV